MAKSTQVVKDERVRKVVAMLVTGRYRWEIVQELSQEWKCSEANVDQYIADAKKQMSDHFSLETVEDILAKYNYLYSDALQNGDKKLAKAVLDSIAKVGEYYKEKVEHSGSISFHTIETVEVIRDNDTSD